MFRARLPKGSTIIKLADTPEDWVLQYPGALTGASGPAKALSFSDYAVVVQAALLGQGMTLGWITVVAHWLLTGALVPASAKLVSTRPGLRARHPAQPADPPRCRRDQGLDHRANAQRHRGDRQALPAPETDGRQLLMLPALRTSAACRR